jgi:hypothetical protein
MEPELPVAIMIEELRDQVDEQCLGMKKNIWLRGIRGSVWSNLQYNCITQSQGNAQLHDIDSFFEHSKKDEILRKLAQRHWYVGYLMNNLIQQKSEAFDKIKGSTLDLLYKCPDDANTVNKIAHDKARTDFFNKSCVNKTWMAEILPMGTLDDIHWTVLYGHKAKIKEDSLCMSSDGKYLRSTDCSNATMIWDMENGTEFLGNMPEKIQWSRSHSPDGRKYCVTDKLQQYYAVIACYYGFGEKYPYKSTMDQETPKNLPVIIEKRGQPIGAAIVLFKKPTEASYICQQALDNICQKVVVRAVSVTSFVF